MLPRPSQIVATLWQRMPAIWPHAVQTLYTTLVGFALGILDRHLARRADRLVEARLRRGLSAAGRLLAIPKVAVVPIFVLWFGAGTVPAVLTAMIMCIFPIVVNVATGLATTEPELEDVMKRAQGDQARHLWNVGLPRAMPYFFASLKVAMTQAFVGTVISETVASNRGIGNMMMIASSSFDVPLVFAGLFILAVLGVALYVIFSLIEVARHRDGPIAKTNSPWVDRVVTEYRTLSPTDMRELSCAHVLAAADAAATPACTIRIDGDRIVAVEPAASGQPRCWRCRCCPTRTTMRARSRSSSYRRRRQAAGDLAALSRAAAGGRSLSRQRGVARRAARSAAPGW